MNYFEFYELPIAFELDAGVLKRRFYAKSKALHPDFYTLEAADKQEEMLLLAGYNNEAYQVLSDPDRRMKYVLQLKGVLADEGNAPLPQAFLMEMMDINERLMELEFDFDAQALERLKTDLTALEARLLDEVQDLVAQYDDSRTTQADLEKVKDFFLKKRYLLRISENLSTFATR